ncbi:MAG TPA: hypothetical protein VFS43_39445 [Polyangiaceae bacterium]|nr:hypothetical protein [Polyangiaceae bacterium]
MPDAEAAGGAAANDPACDAGGATNHVTSRVAESGRWGLTGGQKNAYCRADAPADRHGELEIRAVLTLQPSASRDGASVRLACEWFARVNNYDAERPGAPEIDVAP